MQSAERIDDAPDVEVLLHGTGHVLFKPVSDKGLAWYFEHCFPTFWPYFHWRRYGDTPYGWYDAWQDTGMVLLIADLLRARLAADALDLTLSEDDEGFRHRLRVGDYQITEEEKAEWWRAHSPRG